ncbi:Asr1405/Asl0597 family protein [Calothrix sp. 336/3]|uniref:Asr1405/Asl0597 family protein n=1 Tax=Calothrix sp. 336/3 TaxID=1337936 RepID=UPI0004E4440E|nr:Asr1405/Asl0597 family protein [Calothrix sp. 336/3]AKG22802.1 hypothetical protein IJ00_17335 [Calothrix sp. 336/3]
MKSFNAEIQGKQIVEIDWAERWQVYQRLQELDIPCWCQTNQPLTVQLEDVSTAVQFWGVMRRLTATRQELIGLLETCWQQSGSEK